MTKDLVKVGQSHPESSKLELADALATCLAVRKMIIDMATELQDDFKSVTFLKISSMDREKLFAMR